CVTMFSIPQITAQRGGSTFTQRIPLRVGPLEHPVSPWAGEAACAVDRNHLAADIRGGVRHEEGTQVDEIIGLPGATKRNILGQFCLGIGDVGVEARSGSGRWKQPWR